MHSALRGSRWVEVASLASVVWLCSVLVVERYGCMVLYVGGPSVFPVEGGMNV